MKKRGSGQLVLARLWRAPFVWVRLAVTCLVLLVTTVDANAQLEGLIRVVEGTPDGYECRTMDTTPGIKTIAVLHLFNLGATAVRFRIEPAPGMTMALLSESHHYPSTVGNVTDGISICYGSCAGGDLTLVTLTYMSFGTSDNCSEIRVVPHPDAQTVEQMNCFGLPARALAQNLTVARTVGVCVCPSAHFVAGTAETFDCTPVPVATTTWGGIKALYR